MSVQVENLEKNMAKLTVEIPEADFEKAIESVYLKNKNKFSVPGFRKGKVPRKMIEKMYGVGVFYEDAFNEVLPKSYEEAAKESGLVITSEPNFAIVQMEPGKPVIYTATVATKPDVTLGEYKGLEVPKADVEVTEDEVLAEIKKEQEKNATQEVVDRPIESGDIAIIDFKGFVDGVAFEGGEGEGYALTIGSGQFIPGFEDQLIGKKGGEDVDVNVTFPTPYQAKELEGKDALFKVSIQEVKEKKYPELDDEFASEVSEFETLDEYKADVKKKLEDRKATNAKHEKENVVVEKAVAGATMEIPLPMINTRAKQMVDDFSMRLQQQGLNLQQYMQYTGLQQKQLMDDMTEQAKKNIESRLVLEAVAAAEGLSATEEEVQKSIADMAASYGMDAETLSKYIGEDEKKQMAEDVAVQKAVDFLVENSKEI
ncbi:MAG: trigger factor [Lachnospiraceae bacterium]|nr:trigger factor [Lachnospiraceae bacterium]